MLLHCHLYRRTLYQVNTAFYTFSAFSYTTSVVLSAGSPFVTVSQPMKVRGKNYRAVWMDGHDVVVINQPLLPHRFRLLRLKNHRQTAHAIKTMIIRGAGTIGTTAAYGMAQAYRKGRTSTALIAPFSRPARRRPT